MLKEPPRIAHPMQLFIRLYEERATQEVCAVHVGISVAGVKKRQERLLAKLRMHLSVQLD